MINHLISLGRSVNKYIESDSPELSDMDFFTRMNICKDCEKFNKLLTKCNECGCFLQIKARWSTENCPLNKWPATHIAGKKNIDDSTTAPPHYAFLPAKSDGDCGCKKSV